MRWYGALLEGAATANDIRVTITADSRPRLWVFDESAPRIQAFDLEPDGSIRRKSGSTMAADSTNYQIWFPRVDFDEPKVLTQLRHFWVLVDTWS